MIADGDRIATRWRLTGTYLAPELDFAPTGRNMALGGATIFIVREGALREGWNLVDVDHFYDSLRASALLRH